MPETLAPRLLSALKHHPLSTPTTLSTHVPTLWQMLQISSGIVRDSRKFRTEKVLGAQSLNFAR